MSALTLVRYSSVQDPSDSYFLLMVPSQVLMLGFLFVLFTEPSGSDAFRFRIEGDAVPAHHMKVSEEGILVAGKGEVGDGHGNAHVHPHHAAMGPAHELPGIIAVLREDAGAVGKPVGVHDGQAFLKILHPLDGGHRTEDLAVADAHAGFHMIKDGGPDKVTVLKAGDDDVRGRPGSARPPPRRPC